MQQRKYGSIMFHKRSKMFVDIDNCSTHELSEAYIYESHKQAESDLEGYDNPNEYEIWDIEIIYQTIED
jgi:hypothetical protein